MSATPIKATRKKAPRLPVPPPAAAPLKTNLALTANTVSALDRLKALGYSKTFAIERGVILLEQTLKGEPITLTIKNSSTI